MLLRLMGFRLGLQIGKPWQKRVAPNGASLKADFDELLHLEFDHPVAARGTPLRGNVRNILSDVVTRTFAGHAKARKRLARS